MKKNVLVIGMGVLIVFAFMMATDQISEVNASFEGVSPETAPCSVLNKQEEISVSKGEYKSESKAKNYCERALDREITASFADCVSHCTTKENYQCLPDWQGPSPTCDTEVTDKKCVKWGRGKLIDIVDISGGSRPVYERVCLKWASLYTGSGGGIAVCNCLDIPEAV